MRFLKYKPILLFVVGLVLTVTLSLFGASVAAQQAQVINQPEQLDWAIAEWEKQLEEPHTNVTALHNNLAVAYRQKGQLPQAIEHWETLIQLYQAKQPSPQLLAALIDQAQAYIALGQTRRAIPQLQDALKQAEALQLLKEQAVATEALGNAYFISGNFDQAIAAYEQSLRVATQTNSELMVAALNNLSNAHSGRYQQYLLKAQDADDQGNTEAEADWLKSAQQEQEAALAAAKRAVRESEGANSLSAVRARLHLMRLEPGSSDAETLALLHQIPPSRSKIFLMIELARLNETAAIELLQDAVNLGERLGDRRSESYALGELARIYEEHHQYAGALKLAQQAQKQAQAAIAPESLYRWQWLSGQIYRATEDLEGAKNAYRSAVSTLQDIRSNIVAAPETLQSNFRREVEPVYREFLELLLDGDAKQVKEAVDVFQRLQFKELQVFFGSDCLEIERNRANLSEMLAQSQTALIYSIILSGKTYIVLQLPNGSFQSYTVDIPSQTLSTELQRWRSQLENVRLPGEYQALSQHFYDVFIRPVEKELATANPQTLVFINDGLLRNVPMAALHDGQQFLIEKYPVALSLGFNLSASHPSRWHSLIFGITEAVEGWPPLPNVSAEAEEVKQVLGGAKYLNGEFTLARFQEKVKEDYSVVHLATHGQFVGTADSSFLLAYNERIFLAEFEQLLSHSDRPIELLTLSACQTAAGNERAVLGMAGVAARAGVKKTLGTCGI